MKKFLKLAKKHKVVTIVVAVILVLLILFLLLRGWFFLFFTKSDYGDRLEGIEDVPIEDDQVKEIEDKIKDYDYVESVEYRLQGRLVYVDVVVKEDADKQVVKELANVLLDTFTDEQKAYYDLQILINSDDYAINYIGYKHKTSDAFVWTNNE